MLLLERNGRYVDMPTIDRSTDTWGSTKRGDKDFRRLIWDNYTSQPTYNESVLCTVTVRNREFDQIETYEIISGKREIKLDLENDKIQTSEDSPIGKAFKGQKVGCVVRVRLPKGGVSEYEILEIK